MNPSLLEPGTRRLFRSAVFLMVSTFLVLGSAGCVSKTGDGRSATGRDSPADQSLYPRRADDELDAWDRDRRDQEKRLEEDLRHR